jgi:hypothetical protein
LPISLPQYRSQPFFAAQALGSTWLKRLALFLGHGAPLVGATAVDGALDLEQRIGASDRLLLRIEQRLEAVVAVGLQDTGEGGQMLPGILASSVARGVIDRRRRLRLGEGQVILRVSAIPGHRFR